MLLHTMTGKMLVLGAPQKTEHVELGHSRRGMVRHRLSTFERTAIFEIRRDARAPEGMIADGRFDPGGPGARQSGSDDSGRKNGAYQAV